MDSNDMISLLNIFLLGNFDKPSIGECYADFVPLRQYLKKLGHEDLQMKKVRNLYE